MIPIQQRREIEGMLPLGCFLITLCKQPPMCQSCRAAAGSQKAEMLAVVFYPSELELTLVHSSEELPGNNLCLSDSHSGL